jgi:hypothetical protein
MVDEDVVGLARAIPGAGLAVCDLCGQPVPRASLIRIAGSPELSEPVEALHACEECRIRIEQVEVSYDEEIAAGLQVAEE